MGAWGEKAFQNDSALDWLGELEGGGVATLRQTLSRVAETDENDDVDVDDGAAAIAAAEIVAAGLGGQKDRLVPAAGAWLDRNLGALVAGDATLAIRAVKRVLDGASELGALWEEGGEEGAWHADVRVLIERLGGDVAGVVSEPGTPRPPKGEGRARADGRDKQVLLTFLGARGLVPTAAQMARIRFSQDAAEIRGWLRRAVDAPSVAAVLDE